MITEKLIKSAEPRDKLYQLSAGDGLTLYVEPTGLKYWKYRYTNHQGQRTAKKLGNYPELTLKKAKIAKALFIAELEQQKDELYPELDFNFVAHEWLEFKKQSALGDMPKKGVIELASKCIERDLSPVLGDIVFSDIKRLDLVKAIRLIEKRGVKEPCKKACSYLNQIYDYAVSVGYTDINIAIGLQKVLVKTKIKQNYAHLDKIAIIEFFNRLAMVNCEPIIKKAIYLKIYTGVRGAEILNAKAEQFDLIRKVWNIPAIQVKQLRRKVIAGHKVPDYVVPLSDQAVEVVESAINWSHGERYLFASPRKVGQHIHYNAINTVIRRMGYTKEQLTSHGLRASMSTVLNESNLFKSEWIEAQLSHTDKDAVRGTYNHADYLDNRAVMMQWWADYLNGTVSM